MVVAATALVVAAAGTASGSWAAPGSARVAAKVAVKPTVSTVVRHVDGIEPGSVETVETKCPAGTSVIGGSYTITGASVFAHAGEAAVFSKDNSYGVYIVNPPGIPVALIRGETAGVTVAAICAKNNTPIIVNGRFARP
jgi:hypothetical protein